MGLVNLLERLTELGQTLTFTTLLKDMIKDPYEQPNEETRRAQPRGGGRLRAGASVSGELGWVRRPPSAQVLTMLGACSPQAVGVLVEAFMGVDRLCTLLLNPSPLWRMGTELGIPSFWSRLGLPETSLHTAAIPVPAHSRLVRIKDALCALVM